MHFINNKLEKFFSLNIIGEMGSINMDGLCKWGPSILKIRKELSLVVFRLKSI